MRVLLDVSEAPRRSRPHAFLWYVGGDAALSKTCYGLIESTENAVFVSTASLWEVAIKASLRKLEFAGALVDDRRPPRPRRWSRHPTMPLFGDDYRRSEPKDT